MKSFFFPTLLFFLFLSTSLHAGDPGLDPYSTIEHIKLTNGLQVYLAPSEDATMTAIRLEVGVGWEAEDPSNWGVSHLLEHVLFRDKQHKDEMSYLQLIREAGGEANGTTQERQTSYFGSIPSKKGAWLLENFAKMILEPNISENYVEKEKGTVELERGRPGPITQMLGFNPRDYLIPLYLTPASFWESEFGVSFDTKFTLTQEQLSNQKLKATQVQEHYENYYYPSNMKLFVAGKFDREQILKQIQTKWSVLPARTGQTLAPTREPKPRQQIYQRMIVSEATPYVYLGTKVWNVSVRDEEVIRSYMEYLAHRLMKEVRNLKGQTYTASANWQIYKGYGYSLIQFQTQKENLEENLSFAKKYLFEEAENGGLAADKIKEAKDLFLSGYHLRGREAENMMSFATYYDEVVDRHGKFTSPFASLRDISPEEYNATLRKYFPANQRYEMIYRPALFFPYDYLFMYFFTAVFLFMGLRRYLTKPFANDQVRWIRNVKFPPLKALEGIVLLVAWYLFAHVDYLIHMLYSKFSFLQSHVIFSQYAMGLTTTFCLLVIAQGLFSLVPRKLMVVGEHLVIKSVTYFSRKIPLSEIKSVETVRTIFYPFPLSFWLGKVKMRYFFFNLRYWQKGLMVELKDGRAFYFSVSAPEKTRDELRGLIHKTVSGEKPGEKAA